MSPVLDWAAPLAGAPLDWLLGGLAATLMVTAAGGLLATGLALPLLGLRTASGGPGRWAAVGFIEVMRNTPLVVQLLFWYFAAYGFLPQGLREWILQPHPWAAALGAASFLTPEFLTAAWGLGLFFAAFLAEDLRSGFLAIPPGQFEAARAQGLSRTQTLLHVLAPQAARNAWQPMVGQYLNLMKLSSLASAIGLAELTYQVRQVESFNARGFEAMAAGTALYLLLGLAMGRLLTALGAAAFARRRRRGA